MTVRKPSNSDASLKHALHQRMGRFDQSFFIRMTVSFMMITIAVAAIEMGLRFGLVLYQFQQDAGENAQIAAERLADDVRTIMLNRGGPLASRTVYPILQRSLRRGGLEIAIEPSAITLTSIHKVFSFEPRGIPATWPTGAYREGRVELRAEEVCLSCHSDGRVGDVLGVVSVRDYLQRHVTTWWEDVRITGGVNLATIVAHSVILFFLLRSLMAPLLSLRSAVSQLAKGAAGLSTRAQVRSSDEFGELANDLNAFLDRIAHILADLERTVVKMVAVNTRLSQVTGRTKAQLVILENVMEAVRRGVVPTAAQSESLPAAELTRMESFLYTLEALSGIVTPAQRAEIGEMKGRIQNLREEWERSWRWTTTLPQLVHEVHTFRHFVDEIAFLEEHLNDVVDLSKRLLDRLTVEPAAKPALPSSVP